MTCCTALEIIAININICLKQLIAVNACDADYMEAVQLLSGF